jgi:pimeloyl-ACP methyl ester carboxylesterase
MKRLLALASIAVLLVTGGALAVLWTPDIAHEELVARYANAESRFVTLPSGTVAHYRVQGRADAPTLLLLHGSNASLHTWEPWVAELGGSLRVVTVDLPGHGLTGPGTAGDYTYGGMINFVREFTQAIDIKKFMLGGNSMGGAVTLSYALQWPEDLSGLVLVDAAGLDLPFDPGSKADLPLAFRLAGRWYASWALECITPRSIVEEGLRKSFSNQALVDEAMVQRYWELARHPGNRAATGARFAWYRDGRRALEVGNIQLPTLILWGDKDRLIPIEIGRQMHAQIAGSVFVPLAGVGHIPQEEAVRESAATVALFALGIRLGNAVEALPVPGAGDQSP